MADATRLTEGRSATLSRLGCGNAPMGTKQPMTETLVNNPSPLRRLSRLHP